MVLKIRLSIIGFLLFIVTAACTNQSASSGSSSPVPLSLGGNGALNSDGERESSEPDLGNLPGLGDMAGIEPSPSRTGGDNGPVPRLMNITESSSKQLFWGFPSGVAINSGVRFNDAPRLAFTNLIDLMLTAPSGQDLSLISIRVNGNSYFIDRLFYGTQPREMSGYLGCTVSQHLNEILFPAATAQFSQCMISEATQQKSSAVFDVERADLPLKRLFASGSTNRKVVLDLNYGSQSVLRTTDSLRESLGPSLQYPRRIVAKISAARSDSYSATLCSCRQREDQQWEVNQQQSIRLDKSSAAAKTLNVEFRSFAGHNLLRGGAASSDMIASSLSGSTLLQENFAVDFSRPRTFESRLLESHSRGNAQIPFNSRALKFQLRLQGPVEGHLLGVLQRKITLTSASAVEGLNDSRLPAISAGGRMLFSSHLSFGRDRIGAIGLTSYNLLARSEADEHRDYSLNASAFYDGSRYVNRDARFCLLIQRGRNECRTREMFPQVISEVDEEFSHYPEFFNSQNMDLQDSAWLQSPALVIDSCRPTDCQTDDAQSYLRWNLDSTSGSAIVDRCGLGRTTTMPVRFCESPEVLQANEKLNSRMQTSATTDLE